MLLARFADREGSNFMRHFYRKYRGKTPDEMLEMLANNGRRTADGLAAIFGTLEPDAGPTAFGEFLLDHLPEKGARPQNSRASTGGEGRAGSLNESGHRATSLDAIRWPTAAISPKCIRWNCGSRATCASTRRPAGASARRQRGRAARGLRLALSIASRVGQNARIATLLEMDAFAQIHRSWQRLGYPFESLVPSYATAIGSSGDGPRHWPS